MITTELFDLLADNPVATGWRHDLEPAFNRKSRPNARTWTQQLELNRTTYKYPASFEPDPDWIPDWIQVEDQGQIGSCAGNAGSSCGEICKKNESDEYQQYSRMGTYLRAQEKDGLLGRDDGATIESVVNVSLEGFSLESGFPYPSRYTAKIPPDARHNLVYAVPGAMPMTDRKTMFDWIMTNQGPVFMGMRWTQNMDQQSVVESFIGNQRRDRHGGGHAIFFYGWRTIRGKIYLLLWNSWSRRWGNEGRKPVAAVALDQIFRDKFTRCYGFRYRARPEVQDWSKLSFI